MSDRIHVRDLRLQTVLGVHDWERESPREVIVNLVLEADLSAAARTDELAETVDYGDLCRHLLAHAAEARYRLIEALAGSIARLVLDRYLSVQAVTVRVDKPGAVSEARSVAVELRVVR